jgi:hypothetical protein
MSQLSTAVAFLVFNRPQTTARVWESIRQARPPKLLIVADGPRADRAGEAERCADVRAICERVDWPCDVLRNYADSNLGCRRRVSSGLDWVFETVEEAIILEDDCLPHPTFFPYCRELLARYRDDERIMLISGDNFQPGPPRTEYSYYFSRYPHIWGWASWRRAWRQYDVNISLWPTVRDGRWLLDILQNRRSVEYWSTVFDRIAQNQLDTWDYQVTFACFCQHMLTIIPRQNLVSNIGFSSDATHTIVGSPLANLTVEAMQFPLEHPLCMFIDSKRDELTARAFFTEPQMLQRILAAGKTALRRLLRPARPGARAMTR